MSSRLYALESKNAVFRSVGTFLNQVKNTYFNGIQSDKIPGVVDVVCGNEAADFDSIVCAISHAFFSSSQNPERLMVPIIDIPIEDFALRRDVVHVLEQMNIQQEQLFFRDHLVNLQGRAETVKAVLVDHNKPSNELKGLVDEVGGIIDHHVDSGLYLDAMPRYIQLSGSCSSLVFKYWYERIADLGKMAGVLPLCLGAGVIDTSNFTNRCIEVDLEARDLYELCLPGFDSEAFYKQLKAVKDNIEGLTTQQILKKDYKHFTFINGANGSINVGIASVVKPIKWLYQELGGKPKVLEESANFLEEMQLDVFVVMTSFVDEQNKFRRELVVMPANGHEEIVEAVLKQVEDQLQLKSVIEEEILSEGITQCIKHWHFSQCNTKASRKQVAPYLEEAFQRM